MTLHTGRPADCAGRLAKELRCYDFLDALGVPYQRIDHPPTDTMAACAAVDAALDATICKNLLLCNRQRTAFYLLLIPGRKQLRTGVVSRLLGSSRLCFADPEYMAQFLDITPGSLSILGLMNDHDHRVRLVIDEEVRRGAFFGCHPCINTASLRIATADLLDRIIPALGHTPTYLELPEA